MEDTIDLPLLIFLNKLSTANTREDIKESVGEIDGKRL